MTEDNWTEARIDTLCRMRKIGHPLWQISDALNISLASVRAKAGELLLNGRISRGSISGASRGRAVEAMIRF